MRIQAITDAMHSEADRFAAYADEILTSQNSISKLVGNMGHDFSGKLPSLITQNMLSMGEKYRSMNENLKEYSGFIHHAAKRYDADDAQLAAMAEALGVGIEALKSGGTGGSMPGAEAGHQVPRDSDYYDNVYSRNGYRGQCTWYALGRSEELTGKKIQWNGRAPNAYEWPEAASNFELVTMPDTGNIMVWGPGMGGAGNNGHVAVIEGIEPIYKDGKIVDYNVLYSQANWETNSADWSRENPETDGIVTTKKLSELQNIGITFLGIV
jgi:surface antigen